MMILSVIALILLIIGFTFDILNLFWAFQMARGESGKSGIVFVPLLFYLRTFRTPSHLCALPSNFRSQ
jgi:hypothetical protein